MSILLRIQFSFRDGFQHPSGKVFLTVFRNWILVFNRFNSFSPTQFSPRIQISVSNSIFRLSWIQIFFSTSESFSKRFKSFSPWSNLLFIGRIFSSLARIFFHAKYCPQRINLNTALESFSSVLKSFFSRSILFPSLESFPQRSNLFLTDRIFFFSDRIFFCATKSFSSSNESFSPRPNLFP